MTNARAVQQQLLSVPSVKSESAVFVRMESGRAVVNIGASTISVPCVGFYPPVVGMSVRVDWVNGSPSVAGPVTPLNPLGVISGTGSPRATVMVDGVEYMLFFRDGYVPAVGDQVEINWATGVIQGKVTGVDEPEAPGEAGGGSTPFDLTVRAANSGRYQSGSGWWGNDPWASSSNDGIWVYGSRISDAVAGGTVLTCSVFLPLIAEVGSASIGVHAHASIPGGAPSFSPGSLMSLPLGRRSGWVSLTKSVGEYLGAGSGGLGVEAPGGAGYTRWRGTAADGLSGAVRITGLR